MTTELEIKTDTSPMPVTGFDRFIELALNKQVPVETLERLLAMQKEIMAANAKAAYDEAMRRFQAGCPTIQKHKKVMNKDGKTVRYVYAPMDDIIEQVKTPLSENGFSYRLGQEIDKPKPGWMTIFCTATHAAGHSETEKFEIPLGKAEYMTAQQEVGSARTFGARYCFLGVFGIMTGDEDDDAAGISAEKPKEQKQKTSTSTTTPSDKLTIVGEVLDIDALPMPNKPGSFRYKITVDGQEKPFYTFDKKISDLCHSNPTKTATIVYSVSKYGQDIATLTFTEPLEEYKGELEPK